jgi:hypothetical protein
MNLAKALEGMKEARGAGTQVPEREPAKIPHAGTQVPRNLSAQGPKLLKPGLPLQGTAKSSHPDYTAVKIFVRRETHKVAGRKWEDAQGGDFSDLVESLLQQYLGA